VSGPANRKKTWFPGSHSSSKEARAEEFGSYTPKDRNEDKALHALSRNEHWKDLLR
jgi:hypothetical protein